jgi:hypothetical protein
MVRLFEPGVEVFDRDHVADDASAHLLCLSFNAYQPTSFL